MCSVKYGPTSLIMAAEVGKMRRFIGDGSWGKVGERMFVERCVVRGTGGTCGRLRCSLAIGEPESLGAGFGKSKLVTS